MILKRTKKPVKRPTESPVKTATQEPIVESAKHNAVESSNTISSQNQRAIDMAQNLNKKKREVQVPLENATVETEHGSNIERLDIRIKDLYFGSLRWDHPIKSNFEEIGDPDGNFDPEEENIPDEMIMLGKQFKILNSKMN
ncbi:unnamed protein product [Lactuca saligna]|uniref:Uncharacterized protein n=1 Tax=Lactuca saligna TaxID=75948 RepID=A0AA35V7R9_LACSI|nr:unnamed protein product [Lactuca saligna]